MAGLKAYVHCKKPLLTSAHIAKRLKWAEDHKGWSMDDWRVVVFSDESKFNLIGSDGHSWCWRRPREEFDACFTVKKVKHGGRHIMMWGCMTSQGIGQIVCINGNMTAVLYMEILNNDLLGTLNNFGIKKSDIYFQQDNDPKHTAKLTIGFFEKKRLDVLSWPPNSPDMNIIEHVWDYLDHCMHT
ncbi:hypothetical protein AX16_002478 [Volvariella volvacea WC 439]|nr:hypothetical protein AX16_002478 [Volvariella volvacea WC 439]